MALEGRQLLHRGGTHVGIFIEQRLAQRRDDAGVSEGAKDVDQDLAIVRLGGEATEQWVDTDGPELHDGFDDGVAATDVLGLAHRIN